MSDKKSGRSGFIIFLRRAFMRFHIFLYRSTNGVVGSRALKWPFLLLTTTGRKTGLQRVTPLLYLPHEDHYVLIGSNWGSTYEPTWWLNLKANPQAHVQVGRKKLLMTAHKADPEERALLWPLLVKHFSHFKGYEKKLEHVREIPLIVLKAQD